jgi:poly(3-hydroxybutyrate) depolymerase
MRHAPKNQSYPFIILFCATFSGFSPLLAASYRILDTAGGTLWRYTLEVPDNYTGSKPFGFIMMVHGRNSCATWEAQRTGFHAFGARDSFLTVYPEGDEAQFDTSDIRPESNRHWNKDLADFQFLRDLINDVEARYTIDTNRIYMTGHSQGSQMTDLAAKYLSDKIKAFAPVEGGKITSSTTQNMFRIWSPQDDGVSDSFCWAMSAQWAQRDGCDTLSPQTSTQDGYTLYTFNGCHAGTKVRCARFICVKSPTDTGEPGQSCHWWASKPRYQFSSTELILNFFRELEVHAPAGFK